MRILIVEDEPHAIQRLVSVIAKLKPEAEVVATLDSVKASVEWFRSPQTADLAFMDIQLGDGLSFDIFSQVEIRIPVIFVTAYDEYALKAFKVNSIDYVLKPIDEAELKRAFEKYESMRNQFRDHAQTLMSIQEAVQMLTHKFKERFVVRVGEHLRSVEVINILYFLSLEKTTFCVTNDGRKHILDFTLDQLEGMLNPQQFFRINRQYIININSIRDMITHVNSRVRLVLTKSEAPDIIVARERIQRFREWLDR